MNETVVITGAGGVLCSCFARELARQGRPVALLDLNLDAARAVADEINAGGGRALALEANVLDKASLETAAQAVERELGP